MERAIWTDERLDDLARRMDAGFDRIDRDMRELRHEVGTLRVAMYRIGGGMMVAIFGMIAALVTRAG